jgi:hypothetical protein
MENKQPWTVKSSQGIQEPDSGHDISVTVTGLFSAYQWKSASVLSLKVPLTTT